MCILEYLFIQFQFYVSQPDRQTYIQSLRFWGEPGYKARQLLFWMIVALCDCYVSSPKWLELKAMLLTATILLICICSYLSSSVWMLCSWVPPGEVLVTPLQTSLTSRPWSPWMDILSLIDLCSLSPQIWLKIEWLMKILTANYGCMYLWWVVAISREKHHSQACTKPR